MFVWIGDRRQIVEGKLVRADLTGVHKTITPQIVVMEMFLVKQVESLGRPFELVAAMDCIVHRSTAPEAAKLIIDKSRISLPLVLDDIRAGDFRQAGFAPGLISFFAQAADRFTVAVENERLAILLLADDDSDAARERARKPNAVTRALLEATLLNMAPIFDRTR